MAIDQTLIVAAGQGDRIALVQLLAMVQPDIRRFARRSCRRSSDVDDAVQEAMWAVTRHIGALRNVAAFSGWLFAIVKRACLWQARLVFGALIPLEDQSERLIAARPVSELRLDLAAAIQSLPAHYRQVIILRDVEERTIAEIGATLGLSREAVKGRLHRARDLVREYLMRDA